MWGVSHANTNIFEDHCPRPSSVYSVKSHSENTSAGYVLCAIHANTPELHKWVNVECRAQNPAMPLG